MERFGKVIPSFLFYFIHLFSRELTISFFSSRELTGKVQVVRSNFQKAADTAVAGNMKEPKARRNLLEMCDQVDSLGNISVSVLSPYLQGKTRSSTLKTLPVNLELDSEDSEPRSPLERIFEIKISHDPADQSDFDPSSMKGSPKSTRKLKSSSSIVFEEVQKIEERELELIEKMKNLEGKISRSNSFSLSRSGSLSGARDASFSMPFVFFFFFFLCPGLTDFFLTFSLPPFSKPELFSTPRPRNVS